MYNFSRPVKRAFVEDNKFIFNGIDLSNKVVVEKIKRTLIPSKNVRSMTIPGADGAHVFGATYGTRQITVDIRIVEDTFNEALETQLYLASVLSARLPKELYLKDFAHLDVHNLAVLTSEMDLERVQDTLQGSLIFTCYDPFNHANVVTMEAITSTPKVILNNGVEVPIKIVLSVTIDIAGAVTISTNDGQNLILNGPFLAGSTVIYEDYKLKVNGNRMNERLNVVDSSFIVLKSGNTSVSVTGQGSNSCILSFKERRL